jgi:hypothetical protein
MISRRTSIRRIGVTRAVSRGLLPLRVAVHSVKEKIGEEEKEVNNANSLEKALTEGADEEEKTYNDHLPRSQCSTKAPATLQARRPALPPHKVHPSSPVPTSCWGPRGVRRSFRGVLKGL